MKVAAASFTVAGTRKTHNEDAVFFDAARQVFVVCDGVGSSADGAYASRLACDVISAHLLSSADSEPHSAIESVARAISHANSALWADAKQRARPRSSSTTAVAATLAGSTLVVANVGDSRAYLIAERAHQITVDHTRAQMLLDAGVPEPTLPKGAAQELWQSLGFTQNPKIATQAVGVKPGDRIVLCTDGVYAAVSARRMLAISRSTPGAAEMLAAIQERMLESPDRDDCTAIVIEIISA
jgi:PPM family protein phosphatase